MKPHKHEALIKSWAEGAVIEFYSKIFNEWSVSKIPCWDKNTQYRVKAKFKVGDKVIVKGDTNIVLEISSLSWDKRLRYFFKSKHPWRWEHELDWPTPKPKFVPFTNDDSEELVGKKIVNKKDGFVSLIYGAGDGGVIFSSLRTNNDRLTYEALLAEYVFQEDRSPCGRNVL